MDPFAAYRKQQERLGAPVARENSMEQTRRENPHWAMIFDKWDTSKDGLLQVTEVTEGFSMVLGAGSQMPLHHMKQVFAELDTETLGGLNFKQFCSFTRQVSSYMCDNPRWKKQEVALTEKEEKLQAVLERQNRLNQEPDLFEILGLPKSKEIRDLEERKNQAISNNSSARQSRLKMVASTIITGRRFVSAFKSSRTAGSLDVEPSFSVTSSSSAVTEHSEHDKAAMATAPKQLREQMERFSVSSPCNNASRILGKTRHVHLAEDLPQVRALGKRYAGCLQLRFCRDGSQVAGSFFDGGVRIFDVDKGAQTHCINIASFKGGTVRKSIISNAEEVPAFSSESSDLSQASTSAADISRVVNCWEPGTNLQWQPGSGKNNGLGTVDCSGNLTLWDIPRCKESRQPRCLAQVSTGASLSAIAFTADGAHVAVGGDERIVKLYDIQYSFGVNQFVSERQLGADVCYGSQPKGHSLKIVSIAAHPTQPNILVSVGLDRRILLWDTRAALSLRVGGMYGPELAGDAVDIGNDGNTLLAGSHRSNNPIEIYDLRMTHETKPVTSYEWCSKSSTVGGGEYTCQLFSVGWDECNNKTVVAAGENANLARVFELPSDPTQPLKVIGTLQGADQGFWSCAISADAQCVAFGSADGAVCIVDVLRRR